MNYELYCVIPTLCNKFAPFTINLSMKIHFYLRFRTDFGQRILVTGDIETLGMDSPGSALLLEYHNAEFWRGTIEVNPAEVAKFRYRYILQNADGYTIPEGGRPRLIDLSKTGIDEIQIIDTWSHAGEYENVF